jgi:UrcA family protein
MLHASRAFAQAGLALVPALALSIQPAHAATAPNADTEVRQMAVGYGDLDLTTARGRHRLEMRLERSAAMVCGIDPGQYPLPGQQAMRACYDHALNQAHLAMVAATTRARMASRQ